MRWFQARLGSLISMQENPRAGLYAGIINIIAGMAPRGAFRDNIYVVNGPVFTIYILLNDGKG